MAAPEYFHLKPYFAAFCFWGGIIVFVVTVFIAWLSALDLRAIFGRVGPSIKIGRITRMSLMTAYGYGFLGGVMFFGVVLLSIVRK